MSGRRSDPVIRVEELVKEFGGRRVLHGITFHVRRGEIFGLLGPNGAGKTTTMRILLGLLRPTSGRALVFGRSLSEDSTLRRRVGVVLEEDGLFARLSVHENLDFYAMVYGLSDKEERERRIREVLECVGLYDVKDRVVGHLSRGMRRRLALARALVHEPEVLFLDEPMSGLDPEMRVAMRELLIRLSRRERVTILYTSHDLGEVEKTCSRVAVLMGGRIVAQGSLSDMLKEAHKPLVELTFATDEDATRALGRLRSLECVLECRRAGRKVYLVTDWDTHDILRELVRLGVRVEEVRKARRTLEETYLRLVKGGGSR